MDKQFPLAEVEITVRIKKKPHAHVRYKGKRISRVRRYRKRRTKRHDNIWYFLSHFKNKRAPNYLIDYIKRLDSEYKGGLPEYEIPLF